MIKLSINDIDYEIRDLSSLNSLIDKIWSCDDNEIWIYGHGESKLNILTNKDRAFLMYLRYDGDSGYSSRSIFEDKEDIEFILSNGQVDIYPANWTVEKDFVRDSLIEYYKTGKRLEYINWYND